MDSLRHHGLEHEHEHGPQSSPSKRKSKDRPLLTPSGRKLRHLDGIILRNITESIPLRPRRRSNDDESIAGNWHSSSKLICLQEEPLLAYSKSSSDLASLGMAASAGGPTTEADIERPKSGRIRRRSTRTALDNLSWRWRPSESANITKSPDTFFSLHRSSIVEPPIYVSEVVLNSVCPNFRPFDLTEWGPSVTWLDVVTIRVWSKWNGDFKLLVELDISLHSLQYIGSQIENFRHPFPPNCIIFSLSDGIYTNFTDLPVEKQFLYSITYKPKSWEEAKETSSYDHILRMKTLEDCIWDARMIKTDLAKQLDNALMDKNTVLVTVKRAAQTREDYATVQKYLAAEKKRVHALRNKFDTLRKSMIARREAMQRGRDYERSGKEHLEQARPKLLGCKETCQKTRESIHGQQRRILTELQNIYPIEPIPGKSLAFTIRGLYLPNTEFADQNEDEVAAALGYTANLVFMLALYLGIYLRYPVQPMGSNSFIQDHISIIKGARSFPLYSKGAISYRFEYGVFLLNKNIELLMNSQSIIVMDLRNTLPNLSYLLYAITSGNAPIPDRQWPSAPFRWLREVPSKIDKRDPTARQISVKDGSGSAESSLYSRSPIGHIKLRPQASFSRLRDETAIT